MATNVNAVTVSVFAALLGLGLLLSIWANLRIKNHGSLYDRLPKRETELTKRVAELEATVKTLLDQLTVANRQIEILSAEREVDRGRIAQLETDLRNARRGDERDMLVVGGDKDFANADMHMLDGIGVRYLRLWDAKNVAEALTGNCQFKWVHVAAHASSEGVQIGEQLYSPTWWKNITCGNVFLLAACSGKEVAEALARPGRFVVYLRENVPTAAATDFTQRFWQRIVAGWAYRRAFVSACDSVREVESYADYIDGGQ